MTLTLNDILCSGCKRRVRYFSTESDHIKVCCKLDNGELVSDHLRLDCPDFIQEAA